MVIIENEIWKPIKGYSGYYEISNKEVIKSVERKVPYNKGFRTIGTSILSTRINNRGYREVRLSKDGKTSTKLVHILSAEAFVPNLGNKPEVNHKNGIKTDNRPENLEWVTHSENMKHAYSSGLCNNSSKEVKVKDCCNNIIFTSIKQAAEHYKIPYSTCKNYLSGKRKNPTCLRYLEKAA